MARKEITTPLDLKNMDNHNYNYDELYGLIDETDRRISEDMWEEIKDANTMKMLEPVQRAADLPSEAADKSLITVIDEQRVYSFVNGEWQPFNQIDLDPFEPFKDELSEIVAAYEKQIQSITTEVQNTKTSAIDSIESTQSQSESQISTIRDEMTAQASELTALFNDSMDKLTSKQDTALAEVDSAKQAAIAALEDFQNVDTSNWQKHKLTDDNGNQITNFNGDYPMTNENLLSAKTGFYYNLSYEYAPSGSTGYVFIQENGGGSKKIYYSSYIKNDLYIKTYHNSVGWQDWKELAGVTRDVLFEGSSKGVGSLINLKEGLSGYASITVSGHYPGGRFNETHTLFDNSDVVVNRINLSDSDGGKPTSFEMHIQIENDSTLLIEKELENRLYDSRTGVAEANNYEINHIMGWT